MEWMWLKMALRKLTGTSGLGLGSKTSQMRSLPPTWNSLICREVEAAAAWVSVQPACASASRRRSKPPAAGVAWGPVALAGPVDTAAADAAGCTAGEEGRGFGLPLCRAVARDPAGSFTLATAERGGRAGGPCRRRRRWPLLWNRRWRGVWLASPPGSSQRPGGLFYTGHRRGRRAAEEEEEAEGSRLPCSGKGHQFRGRRFIEVNTTASKSLSYRNISLVTDKYETLSRWRQVLPDPKQDPELDPDPDVESEPKLP
jgi:hypothetical protein